jgi:hypothetical protein
VKKFLFAAGGALACGLSVFAMDRATFDREVLAWSKDIELLLYTECAWEEEDKAYDHIKTFNIDILKKLLREELGDDPRACEAFDLFHSYRLFEFIDHVKLESVNMTAINAEKFREALIAIAPIMKCFAWETPKAEEYLHGIIGFVGGNPDEIRAADLEFPQFCFEMLMRARIDMEDHVIDLPNSCVTYDGPALAQAFESVCGSIAYYSNWDVKRDEGRILEYFSGRNEDYGGSCHLWDVWPNLSKKAE